MRILNNIIKDEELRSSESTSTSTMGGNKNYIYFSILTKFIKPSYSTITLIFTDEFLFEQKSYWNLQWTGEITPETMKFDSKKSSFKKYKTQFLDKLKKFYKLTIKRDYIPSIYYGEIIVKKPVSFEYCKEILFSIRPKTSNEIKLFNKIKRRIGRKYPNIKIKIKFTNDD
jgi:hypothetical protein